MVSSSVNTYRLIVICFFFLSVELREFIQVNLYAYMCSLENPCLSLEIIGPKLTLVLFSFNYSTT